MEVAKVNKLEREQSEHQDRQLDYWQATDKEHKQYLKEHPAKPLTPQELKWLEDYQRMTRDPRWW